MCGSVTPHAAPHEIALADWCAVDPDALPEARKELFLRRRRGIEAYCAGGSEDDIRAASGFGRSHIYRLITERCLQQHPDGTLNGWRGVVPHLKLKPWKRKTKLSPAANGAGAAGALQWLFASPGGREIEERFRNQIIGKTPKLANARRAKRDLFAWFIRELQASGYEARGDWPFNVEKMGYVTIGKFIDRVLDENPRRQRQLMGGQTAERKAKAGDGTARPQLAVFQRVECDAHKLDARMVVLIPSPHGGYEPRKIHRLWVIVIIEVVSRAVLGYYLSLRHECGAEDVLRAVKRALTRWRPRALQFSSRAYVPEAGLPSGRHERYVGACWDEFSVDGALANICDRVERQLSEVVGATILKPQDPASYSSRRSLDDRPYIESFFRQLAGGGFHRLAVTTGSKPADKRGHDPDAVATATQFQIEHAEELLDVLIANYNATPHSGLGYRSPLAQLDFLTTREPVRIRQADPGQVNRMVTIRKLCTVKGGVATGRRPYFNFANARYSAEWLCQRTDLVGKNCWLHIEDEDDARWASVSTQRGEFLGAVRAAPPWHLTPHTLYMRTAIRALDKRRLLQLSGHCDAVEELIRYAEGSASKKLPPHPAYLEARRVLRAHAEALAGQPILAASKHEDEPSVQHEGESPATGSSTATDPASKADTASNRPKPSSRLPPMRMAKTW